MFRLAMLAPFGALIAVLVAPPAQAAECVVVRHAVVFDADSDVRLIAESGKDCRVVFPLQGKARVDKSEITTHPLHGGVRLHGVSGAYYRSNPGYKGPDHFAFSFCGEGGGRTGCADILVKVEVR